MEMNSTDFVESFDGSQMKYTAFHLKNFKAGIRFSHEIQNA